MNSRLKQSWFSPSVLLSGWREPACVFALIRSSSSITSHNLLGSILLPDHRMLRMPLADFFTTLPFSLAVPLSLDFSLFCSSIGLQPLFQGQKHKQCNFPLRVPLSLCRVVGMGPGTIFWLGLLRPNSRTVLVPPFSLTGYLGRESRTFFPGLFALNCWQKRVTGGLIKLSNFRLTYS